MTEMTMKERVARAIMAAREPEGQPYIGTRGVTAEAEDNPHCARALRQAEAAIAAIAIWQSDNRGWETKASRKDVFDAMADSALSEQPQ